MLNLVNIYAPTNKADRKSFFSDLTDYLFLGAKTIIGGNFNCIEKALDKFGGNTTLPKDELKNLRADMRLTDSWRKLHPYSKQTTWLNSNKTIGSRPDKLLIQTSLQHHVEFCEIHTSTLSDHDSVHIHIKIRGIYPRGPRVCRLNSSLLKTHITVKSSQS